MSTVWVDQDIEALYGRGNDPQPVRHERVREHGRLEHAGGVTVSAPSTRFASQVAQELERLRVDHRMTYAELSRRSGMGVGALQRRLHRETVLTIGDLVRITHGLDCQVGQILDAVEVGGDDR